MVSRIAPMLCDFMRKESAGGITLIFAAFAALVIANSPLLGAYKSWLDIPIVAGFGGFVIDKPLLRRQRKKRKPWQTRKPRRNPPNKAGLQSTRKNPQEARAPSGDAPLLLR